MKELSYEQFAENTEKALKQRKPLSGQIDLTYRCGLDCIHCYSKKVSNNKKKELTVVEIKHLLDEVYREGCLWLCLTGGDPLIREDFLEIYTYARNKGFLVTIFTNGTSFTSEIIDCLEELPPLQIDITLNSLTKETYEGITQVKESFEKVMRTIEVLAEKRLPLVLKTNGLKQNKNEILKIKSYTENLLGKGKFKFDFYISPCLDGRKDPLKHRLGPKEVIALELQDKDMITQRLEQYHSSHQLKRDSQYMYQCTNWLTHFFVNPYGRLGFCHLTQDFSVDLRRSSFKKGFFEVFPRLLREKFKTNSKCISCCLREDCLWCPVRTFLEVGDKEQPVDYFCRLAKTRMEQKETLCKS